ncbi:MAG: ATP phosphoribosyltransferase regulatory subunit [Rickettsiales bacterium]|jgi:ATP phosphoribosyltransferase regulatory subunit
MTKSLLPSGCYDLLPPTARQESELSHTLLSVFESFGYEQVSPPLLEYSDSLLAGRGNSFSSQIFRVMDPTAHKVMGIRADITLQISRIAMTRLSHAPRPLRLCYNGLILRMQGEQLKKDRQLNQTGIELIGAATPEADAEVILVAAEALNKAGITNISIDLNLPGIVGALLVAEKLDEAQLQAIMNAVAHKNVSTISSMSFSYRDTLIALMQSAGVAETALDSIERLDLPDNARQECANLRQVVKILRQHNKHEKNSDWTITIDATENRGAGYHSGISFSIFVAGVACEVGCGGRYKIQGETPKNDSEATGFTLYLETLLDILPRARRGKRILISGGINDNNAAKLCEDGFVVIYALSEYGNCKNEANRLGCGWIYKDGEIIELLDN